MVRFGNRKDFLSGLMLIGFGLAALWIGRNYTVGTAFRMGPGYFPVVLALLLVVIGTIVATLALRSAKVTLPKFAWRPVLIVTAAVVLFGLIINAAGLVVATFVMVIASRFARSGYSWVETAVLAVALTVLCTAVFYFGLKIQMPLLPTGLN